jgi:putative transposase
VLERGERSERALKLAVAEMYVQGVSTRKVAAITEELCGLEVSSVQVSRAAALLDEELAGWRNRPLGETPYLILDARYEKIRHGGSVVSCAVLVAIGVTPEGGRSVLGVSVSLSEAEVHWREFLAALQDRGLHGVRYIVSDDHAGLKQARQARFAGVPWQRCQFHLAQNAMQYVPKLAMRGEVARDLRVVLDANDRSEADRQLDRLVKKYALDAPKLAAWLETNVPEALTVLCLPAAHRRKLRTTNSLERINKEIKRRTRVATLFPNEASALRLVTAVLMEISEDWETNRTYLAMETN